MPTLTAYTLALLGTQTADARFEQLHHRGAHGRFGAGIDELGAWDRLESESDRKSFSGSVRIGQHPDMAGVNVVAYNEDDDPVLSIDTGTVADHFGPDKGNNFEGDYSIVRTPEVEKLHKALAGASAAAAEGRPFTAIIEGEDAGDIRVDAAGDIAAPRVNVTAYDWNKRPKTDAEVFEEQGGYDPYPPPDREDYDSDEEYQQAVRDYPANLAEDDAEWKALVLEDYRKIPKAPTASLTLAEAARLSEETRRLLTAPPVGAADGQTAAALHEFCRTPLHPGPCEGWKLAQAAGRDHTVRHDDLVAEKRGRKRVAKPKTPKSAAPAAVSSEIPAPNGAGVQHEPLPIPDHVPVPPGVVAARERQANIDHARARADLLAELEEVALLNEAPPDVIIHRAEQTARRLGITDTPELAPVLEAARSGDPDRIQAAIATAASKLGLHKLDDGRMVPYDRSRHKNLGSSGRPGQMMHVVRPGYAATLPGGERVQLDKTVVEEATPQEVIAERARIAPAAIATPPVKGRLKPSEILARARAARGGQTASVDEVNLYRQGMPNLTGFTLAEFGKLTGEALADFNKKHPRGPGGKFGNGSVIPAKAQPDVPTQRIVRKAKPKAIPPTKAFTAEVPKPRARKVAGKKGAGGYTGPTYGPPDTLAPEQTKRAATLVRRDPQIFASAHERFGAVSTSGNLNAEDAAWLQALYQREPAYINHLAQTIQIERALRRNAKKAGETPAQFKAKTAAQLKAAVAGKPVAIRIRDEAALQDVLSNGRFKTSFDRNTKRAPGLTVNLETRRLAEEINGVPANTPPDRRPVYGYVAIGGIEPALFEGRKTPGIREIEGLEDVLSGYGKVQVVLKPEVRERTTVTIGDSLDEIGFVRPSPIDDPKAESIGYRGVDTLAESGFTRRAFVEAQIHNGVSRDDIAEVIFPSGPSAETMQALDSLGIPWRIMGSTAAGGAA